MAAAIAVLGAGSWGTALALQCARAGRAVRLWDRNAELVAALAAERRNRRYLPECELPAGVAPIADLAAAVGGAADVLIAVSSAGFRELLQQLRPLLPSRTPVCWATKGFEMDSGLLPHQVAAQELGSGAPRAVLSGPTFAREVGAALPTAMVVAATDPNYAASLAHGLSTDSFRIYTSADIVGVETGGAVKNVLAVGAGMSDGLGFGANTRVALITRGLVEMTRLAVALGGRRETMMGLAGLGDLVLTCTDDQSRNRRFGLLLAAGHSPAAALERIGQVVEGYRAARAVHDVAARLGVEMPISDGIYRILYEGQSAHATVRELMTRPIKAEN
ncbi:MAG: NAD(P)-dependent glycerol-3-phosphate dehydrogenase [Steroidobacteraceae bacterium]|nr:NAD(P)-dependent glycerol-3-phosphate dehydrogenase [Steroidobacteraceae bacterium]MDW8259910.1 NAD(P)H-dependent glycerol-3-phosphate dehydrogenase [Gammaproteobacteria bacterium]